MIKVYKIKKNNRTNEHFRTNLGGYPKKSAIENNYNAFMQNDTLYGLYEIIFDEMNRIEITGTGDAAKCAPLVDYYLLGKGDDEYIDHIELAKKEEDIKNNRPYLKSV